MQTRARVVVPVGKSRLCAFSPARSIHANLPHAGARRNHPACKRFTAITHRPSEGQPEQRRFWSRPRNSWLPKQPGPWEPVHKPRPSTCEHPTLRVNATGTKVVDTDRYALGSKFHSAPLTLMSSSVPVGSETVLESFGSGPRWMCRSRLDSLFHRTTEPKTFEKGCCVGGNSHRGACGVGVSFAECRKEIEKDYRIPCWKFQTSKPGSI